MERFDSELYLTTSQVAELLSVHPSTVKRWCNEGELEVAKTEGGHRRIHLREGLALARIRGIATFLEPFAPHEAAVWSAVSRMASDGSCDDFRALALDWLRRGRLRRLRRLVFELGRYPLVPFERFCDEAVSGFLRDVGEGWRCGRLRVADEHMAAEAVVEALLRLGASIRSDTPSSLRGARPLAIVGAMEGDRHHVGALCVRLLLERAGWRVLYLGADVPLTDYAALQSERGADLVCISFSPPNGAQDMRRCVRALAERYDADRPYSLALGGHLGERFDADGPGLPFRGLGVHESLASFAAALARGFGGPRPTAKG